VFEGLVPEPHNGGILGLLFLLCHWHALAKLRLHTDDTLKIFDDVTVELASNRRAFVVETCPEFVTKELLREVEARKHRETREHLMKNGHAVAPTVDRVSTSTSVCRPKTLNLQTYKLHATCIEHRQAHIHRISMRCSTSTPTQLEEVPNSPDEHHHIGKAQNDREDLTTFVRRNSDNPATRVHFR
jgi:hypothetical protein